MKWLVTALALAGCYNGGRAGAIDAKAVTADGTGVADAMIDTLPDLDAGFGFTCYGSANGVDGIVRVCVATPAPGSITIVGPINTGAVGDGCDPTATTTAGVTVCVASGDEVHVAGVTATGDLPLVIVGNTISIDGSVDLSGATFTAGAGGVLSCPGGAGGADVGSGGGGGAGGSFAGRGGNGGTVGNGGGMAGAPEVSDDLRGGCAGGPGGDISGEPNGGFAGQPGGALALLAAGQITVTGGFGIRTRGGGGVGGLGNEAGGGGGGAGGLIVLEGSQVVLQPGAFLDANGGGGGQGASHNTQGGSGVDGDAAEIGSAAAGGTGIGDGGNGGASSGAAAKDGLPGVASSTPNVGAGGGGGAAGRIRLFPRATSSGTVIVSPPAS